MTFTDPSAFTTGQGEETYRRVAAELSGYAGKFRCFWRGELKTVCFDTFI